MKLKQEEVDARKDRILAITIDQYIQTVSPVSSQLIAQRYPSELSSASIRNILAELEEEGYLTHPHTSAGRIPTQKGYRYYVDHFMDEIQLLQDEKQRIKAEYTRQFLELDRLFEQTSESLSQTTHYTSIISVENKVFCRGTSFVVEYPDFQDLSKIKNILWALDEKERILEIINRQIFVRKIEILIGRELECADIDSCSLVISPFKTRGGPAGRLAILGPTRMNYKRVVSALDYFSELIEEIL
jgi:transcriptional regulator of heat shock response